MPCINPITPKRYRNMDGNLSPVQKAPCGVCPGCKLRRTKDWMFRLYHHGKAQNSTAFVTLTYAAEHLPISPKGKMSLDQPRWSNLEDITFTRDDKPKLREDHAQQFMKRLRKHESTDKTRPKDFGPITFYCAAEYGEQYWRPHYHFMLYNVWNPEHIAKAWNKGLIDVQLEPGAAAGAYIAGYINKPIRVGKNDIYDRRKEFSRCSQGIGKAYLTDKIKAYHKADAIGNNFVLMPETKYKMPIPRYYRDQIFNAEERQIQNEYYQVEHEIEEEIQIMLKGQHEYFKEVEQKAFAIEAKYNKQHSSQKRVKDGTNQEKSNAIA